MLAAGLSEIMTYSFVSPKVYDKILVPADSPLRKSVVISNPLGEDTSIMRTTALPSMLEILQRNYNNRNASAHLFEIAREYIPTAENELPVEKNKLICGFYGGDGLDFFTVKGIVEALFDQISLYNWDIEAVRDQFAFHPGQCAKLSAGDDVLGYFGQIHPKVAENYGIDEKVYAVTFGCRSAVHPRLSGKAVPSPAQIPGGYQGFGASVRGKHPGTDSGKNDSVRLRPDSRIH